jgi:hypothetical protein
MDDLTPAGELREAARRLRDVAAGVPKVWRLIRSQIVAAGTGALPGTDVIATCMVPERAAYVASMHPAVAVALAEVLEAEADEYDCLGLAMQAFMAGDTAGSGSPDPAVVAARAVLGTGGGQ